MKFSFFTIGSNSYIQANFEDSDSRSGTRQEGAGTLINNNIPLVFFNRTFGNIHPDILGAICIAIFYPFIGRSVELPFPASPRLQETINRPIFTKTKIIEIRNIDHSVPVYSGNGEAVIAYGGGIDSTAVRALFPTATPVHEGSIFDGRLIPDKTNTVVESLQKEGDGELILTNQRYISRPGGWHVWICSAVTAILFAMDQKKSYVLTGANLGSSFLTNGRKYFNKHLGVKHHGESGNYWEQVFWDIGMPVFSPISGVSEILNMSIVQKSGLSSESNYCTANNGIACGICTKCFRRSAIKNFIENTSSDYSNYKNSNVELLLRTRPTYFGHLYAAMLENGWAAPSWILEELKHLPSGVNFPLRYYPKSLDFVPSGIRAETSAALNSVFKPMTEMDMLQLESWDMNI